MSNLGGGTDHGATRAKRSNVIRPALLDADMTEQTVENYVDRASIFVRWLDGRYDPKTIHHRD